MSTLRSLLCAVTLAGLPAFPLTANAAALPETASDTGAELAALHR